MSAGPQEAAQSGADGLSEWHPAVSPPANGGDRASRGSSPRRGLVAKQPGQQGPDLVANGPAGLPTLQVPALPVSCLAGPSSSLGPQQAQTLMLPAADSSELGGSGLAGVAQTPDEQTAERRQLKKTEMNRKAQQRYRRRKKEMFEEQQRLNMELSLKCNELARSSATSQARAYFLESMMDLPHQEAEPAPQEPRPWIQPSLQAFADAMLDFLKVLAPDQDSAVLRQLLLRASTDMMDGNGSTFAFLRKLLAEELAKCIVALGRPGGQALQTRLASLMDMYMTMLHQAGTADLQALLTYLSLVAVVGESPPPANWHTVLDAMRLTQEQVQQLSSAYMALQNSLSRLGSIRSSLGGILASLGPSRDSTSRHVVVALQGENCIDLFRSSIAKERQLIFDFLKSALAVLDPVQHAYSTLASFPHALDPMAVCMLLVEGGQQAQPQPQSSFPVQAPLQGSSPGPNALQASYGASFNPYKGRAHDLHFSAHLQDILTGGPEQAGLPGLPAARYVQDLEHQLSSVGVHD